MIGIAIHGGALNKNKSEIPEEKERALTAGLDQAVEAGWKVLRNNGNALDAVTAAVIALENNIHFNAARGAALTREKTVECDASVMCGKTLNAGAVCGVSVIKNPVLAARMVMEKTPHVMLCGQKADDFAVSSGLEIVRNEYFIEPHRTEEWLQEKLKSDRNSFFESDTVGAVALDSQGDLAAATSTGGLPFRMSGRVGDSPIIGSGTYADNATCAVSFTGDGEKIMRGVYSKEISCLMNYKGMDLRQAAEEIMNINSRLIKAEMGLIAIDTNGIIITRSNTLPMYRAFVNGKQKFIGIWED